MDEARHTGTAAPVVTPSAWALFEVRLGAYLTTMVDPDEGDHLLVEMPGEVAGGCAPYAQFASFSAGRMIRAEVSSNHYLAPDFRLDAQQLSDFTHMGWLGADENERNHYMHRPVEDYREVAAVVTTVLRDDFNIPDPGLLTVQAWGPAARGVAILGLAHTHEVPTDVVDTATVGDRSHQQTMIYPEDAEQLADLIGDDFRDWFKTEPTIDSDGDFVLPNMGQLVWVRVRKDKPAVEIMARVAHGVYSRRTTAVEIGLLNRDREGVKWTLRDRDIWQTALVSAWPFTTEHLRTAIATFMSEMSETRDDLALRTGAKVA